VVVSYTTFAVASASRAEFDEWFSAVAAECEQEEGNLFYRYHLDPGKPGGGILVQAWETEAHLDRHRTYWAHVDIVAFGTSRYGMTDLEVDWWSDEGGHEGHRHGSFTSVEEYVTDELRELVRKRKLDAGAR
jgi:quinol monooxygenase YgiN